MQYAIKFFLQPEDFAVEERLYWNSLIRHTLPELIHSSDNAAGSVRSRSGVPFPPFMVMERGSTLAECACLLHACYVGTRSVKEHGHALDLVLQPWRGVMSAHRYTG